MLSSLVLVSCLVAAPCDGDTCQRPLVSATIRVLGVIPKIQPLRKVGDFVKEKKPARRLVAAVAEKKPLRRRLARVADRIQQRPRMRKVRQFVFR